MVRKLNEWQVFVASPSDVSEERRQLQDIVSELNESEADKLGVRIKLLDWKHKVAPLLGRPQQVIFDQLKFEDTDFLILILWHRFGTPTGGVDHHTGRPFQAGIEEEFTLAYESWRQQGRPQISVYRRMQKMDAEEVRGEQLSELQKFLEGFEAKGSHPGIVQNYKTVRDFRERVRRDLSKCLDDFSSRLDSSSEEGIQASSGALKLARDASPTPATWDDIDTDLLHSYLSNCGKASSLEKEEVARYLQEQGLLADDAMRLTIAGAVALCKLGRIRVPAKLTSQR